MTADSPIFESVRYACGQYRFLLQVVAGIFLCADARMPGMKPFQYSLATMFIVITIICLLIAHPIDTLVWLIILLPLGAIAALWLFMVALP